jgi:glycosyltransferase involved in cell wall biosynthesis
VPLRVAFVAPSLEILGGQAVQADRLLRAWRNDPDVNAWLVPVNPAFPGPLRFARRMKYVRTLVNEALYLPSLLSELSRADVVHVFSASYSSFLIATLPAIIAARFLRRPVLLNYRSGEAPDHLRGSAIARTAIARVNKNVVPSSFLADVFSGFGIRSTIVPNIVDLNVFRFRSRNPLEPRLLSTRNFEPHYNVAATIRAFRLIQDRWPHSKLTLVGGGSQGPALRALAAELGLHGVTFAGRMKPEHIATAYADHHIYIQSPDIDNMPTSILEAFASGLPVVSTEAGGIPAILVHGTHGLLSPIGEHETLAAHVLRLLDQPDHARELARAAYSTCDALTWRAVRQQWLSAYRSVSAGDPTLMKHGGDGSDRAIGRRVRPEPLR